MRLTGITKNVGIVTALLVAATGCLHDIAIPLKNGPPESSRASITDTLYFPDSVVCTLLVSDLNDSILTMDVDSWPGTFRALDTSLGNKRYVLYLEENRMTRHTGTLLLHDQNAGSVEIPYDLVNVFLETFSSSALNTNLWTIHCDSLHGDTTSASINHNSRLEMHFPLVEGATSSTGAYLSAVSAFKLSGDFSITVEFELRDEMFSGFETGYFVSTSAGVGRWDGDRAGVYLSAGSNNQVRLEARCGIDQDSKEISFGSGTLGISRRGNQMFFMISELSSNSVADTLDNSFTYDSTYAVYLHMRMTVDDMTKTRHCTWNDVRISNGTLLFE